nr:ribonuclease H-like domain-containing protein [Tanacetum cinerariifolium]
PPRTAQAILARQRERKAKSILLLAIPDEYQLRFHTIKDAKSLWAAIKCSFGGNVKSKKMQKTVLKQQFEKFSVSNTEGLDKAYDRPYLVFAWNKTREILCGLLTGPRAKNKKKRELHLGPGSREAEEKGFLQKEWNSF